MDISSLEKSELTKLFNDQLYELLEQLQVIVDNLTVNNQIDKKSKSNLDFYKNLVQKCMQIGGMGISNTTNEIVIESFGAYILSDANMVNKIMESDINFFLKFNYSNESTDGSIKDLINIIKNIFPCLTKDNIDIIFEYMQILTKLTVSYASKKYN